MGDLTPGQELFAALPVVSQGFDGRCMQRNQAGLAELGTADRQDAFVEIDVTQREAERFANTQARYAQQSEEAIQAAVCQPLFRWQLQSTFQQAIDVAVREEVWTWPVVRAG